MISKANLQLIEGALEIQKRGPDELAFMARQLVQVTLSKANESSCRHSLSSTPGSHHH